MNVPIVRATTCPSDRELALHFAILITHRVPSPAGPVTIGFLGRPTREADGLFTVADAFDYQCLPTVERARGSTEVRLSHHHVFKVFDGICTGSLEHVHAIGVHWLRDAPPVAVVQLRESLVDAWNGRDFIRSRGGTIQPA